MADDTKEIDDLAKDLIWENLTEDQKTTARALAMCKAFNEFFQALGNVINEGKAING